ncbi:DUF6161 domain-containing protein [Aliiglaciecola sp. LCG003]|uniref:DUF6161 domain-containing protein n=1 Tax=Aliiglaciecola sp. LCG003 TaxID=3053655 RepID=UPI00257473F9|nr:DUF6161 domain-containing protein [Aliiglaciecola sp. LCG003]WJG10247.1 DUF6161 domain-containing protein [Aliiglaciecola sp. LCG003]
MSEEIEQEATKLKRITIKTETGSKWFDDPDKLLAWVQQQRQLYGFHGNVSQRYQMAQLFNTFDNSWNNLQQQITDGLRRFKNDPDNYNKRVEQFSNSFSSYLTNKQLFTEEAPFAPFVQRQAKKSVELGLAALAVAFDANVSPVDRKMYQGLQQADNYFAGSEDRIKDEADSLQQLKERWDEEQTNQRDNWVNEYQLKIDEATRQNSKVDGLISDWQEQTETQTADLETHKEEFKKKFKDELANAKTDLENLTKTYDDKLALHAAVKYWGIQQDSHNDKAKLYAKALGATTVVVLLTIILFAIFGLDKPFKEVAVSRLVTAAAITTFGIWIIKIVGNIFMSHLHLATDAQERRTMIHTYLALTRKGQGPKEEDRQLILQTLFRPSTTDMVKNDQGPTQLVDLINRLSPKQ